jgi:hypothetical protein
MPERWPPVYDAGSLANAIESLVEAGDFNGFYDASLRGPEICQGDVIHLESEIPLISGEGKPIADDAAEYWLVIGNTCDFERDLATAKWTQLVPIIDFGANLTAEKRASIQRYQTSRAFYLPPWSNTVEAHCHVADFLRPVAAEKEVFDEVAKVEARMTHSGWVLLHSCLVRFLCRDDRRFD